MDVHVMVGFCMKCNKKRIMLQPKMVFSSDKNTRNFYEGKCKVCDNVILRAIVKKVGTMSVPSLTS